MPESEAFKLRESAEVRAGLHPAAFFNRLLQLSHGSDTAFIVCLALVYFSWGEVYVLFPSATADLFGSRNASANYGFLYSTKGVASIVGGGLAALLFEKLGSWDVVFYGSAVFALCSALMSIVLMKMPLPRKAPAGALAAAEAPGLSARG